MSADDCIEKKSNTTETSIAASDQSHEDHAYYIPFDEYRCLTVFAGQAYYLSSGDNSSDYDICLITDTEQHIPYEKNEIYLFEVPKNDNLFFTFLSLNNERVHGMMPKPPGFNVKEFAKLDKQPILDEAEYQKLQLFYRQNPYILDSILKIHYPKGNSYPSAKNRWQPIIMINGTKPLNFLDSLPEPYDNKYAEKLRELVRTGIAKLDGIAPDYIIKSFNFIHDDIKAKEKITPSQHFSEFQAKRIALTRFLIISSRLNPDHYSDEQLIAGGLSPEEIKLARIPIHLHKDHHAKVDIAFPDTFNDWLIAMGATYIQDFYMRNPKKFYGKDQKSAPVKTSDHSESSEMTTPKPVQLPSYSASPQFTFFYQPLPDPVAISASTSLFSSPTLDAEKKPKSISFKLNSFYLKLTQHRSHISSIPDQKDFRKNELISDVIKRIFHLIPDLKEFCLVKDKGRISQTIAMSNPFYVRCPGHADELNYYLKKITSHVTAVTGIEFFLEPTSRQKQTYTINVLADANVLSQFIAAANHELAFSQDSCVSYDESQVDLFFMR